MSASRAYLDAVVGVFRRDLSVFLSYRTTAATQLLSSLFSLILFYYVSRLVAVGDFATPDDYYAYAVIGILALELIAAALVILPTTVRQELVAGTFERLVLSPFGPVGGICSMLLFPLIWATGKALLMVCIAVLVFGLPVQGPEALLAIPVAFFAALSFAPFGLLIAGSVLLVKQTLGASNFVIAGISIVAGIYFPTTLLPDAIEWMSSVQPFTPAIELLRNLILGTSLSQSGLGSLAKIVGFAAVLTPASIWFLSRAVDVSRRRGTIIEY